MNVAYIDLKGWSIKHAGFIKFWNTWWEWFGGLGAGGWAGGVLTLLKYLGFKHTEIDKIVTFFFFLFRES